MQRKRRKRQADFWPALKPALLAAALALLASGCPRGTPTAVAPTAPAFGNARVRIGCPDERSAAVVKNYAGGWASRQGAAVEVVRYDPEGVPPDGPDADAWLISPEELPRWAAAGKLAAVPAAYTTPRAGPYEWEHVLPLYRNKLLVWGGTVYALPLLGESPLCFYRTDLVESDKHQADFQKQFGRPLAPPATWEEFEEIARFFSGRKEAGFDGPSLPPLPAADDALDREFYAVAAPFARRAVPQDERKPPPDVE